MFVLIALETDLGPIFGSILGSQTAPKSVPRGSRMSLEIIIVFESLQDPLKINFSANMAATCPQLGPQHAPKLGPKWCQNRSWRPMGTHGRPWSPSEPSLDRIWLDFGTILGWFCVNSLLFFCCFLSLVGCICRPLFGIFLVILVESQLKISLKQFWSVFHCPANLVVVSWGPAAGGEAL